MAKIFEHYHLSLIERAQGDLYIENVSRERWLRNALSEPFIFPHYGKEFHWVPRADAYPMIMGIVTRLRERPQHKGPDENAAEFIGKEWQGSIVAIDPLHRPDGQKVAFEKDLSVGKPRSILNSLVSFLNLKPNQQYTLHFKPLFDSEGFWNFANRHGGILKYISFDFVVPNMFFGTSTAIDTGLKRIGQDTGAQEVKIRIESNEGVRTDSQSVRDAMNYAEAGNANVTARALNGDSYSSSSRIKISKLEVFLKNSDELLPSILEALGRNDENNSVGNDNSPNGRTRER